MVQVIENRAEIDGTVERVSTSAPRGFVCIEVRVEATVAVEGYPDLVAPMIGSSIAVLVRQGALPDDPAPGSHIRARVRRSTPTATYVDTSAPFSVEPPA